MENNQNLSTIADAALPRNQIFMSWWEQTFLRKYRSIFSIAEIEQNVILQWVFGASLLTFYITFNKFVQSSLITVDAYRTNTYSCWPYFQNCGEYYFLNNLPQGYSQPILYSFFFGLMILTIFLMWKKDWVLAHMLLGTLFIWKCVVIFILTSSASGNYDYYDIALTFVLLLLPHKLFFLKLTFVMLYFLASTIKIHEGWVLGTYFTALQTGLPIFPNILAPLFTNTVIFMQMIGVWFLLSSHKVLQRTALIFFLCFHFYSGILVYYRYLTTAMPMLLILFGPLYTATKVPLTRSSLPGWALLITLTCTQFIPFTIPGDQKMTLEGNRFGLYMFEANHQCISHYKITLTDGSSVEDTKESVSARQRCDPYKYWFRLKQACSRYDNITSIAWTFDHSINGGAFYRIVDTADACLLQYKTFDHNNWIKLPADHPEIIGYPVKNVYY